MKAFIRPLFLALSIAIAASSPAEAMRLSFLADANFPVGSFGTPFGGISGLAYDPVTNALTALSDDRGEVEPARFFTVQIAVAPGFISFKPAARTTLHRADGSVFPKGTIDPEAIARLSANRLFVSSEGSQKITPHAMPAIFEIDGRGRVVRSLHIPEKYLPETTGTPTRGVRDNCAFESLTLSPSRSSLYVATECPLLQDGPSATFEKGGLSRVLQFRLQGDHRIPAAEFAYLTEPNAKPEGATRDYGNGISEMLALNERELLVLERGTADTPGRAVSRIRLFKAILGNGATNVSELYSLRNRRIVPVRKQLVLDFNSIAPKVDPRWPTTDNLEAMTFGPILPNGHRTLLFVSDDNFNPSQRTQVLAFEILD